MRELMKNAQMGWLQYTNDGKFAALLLVALLLFWFGQKEVRGKNRTLIWYTTIMAIVCICPVTAMLLMKYQTKFYDYQWIWNLVPVTAVIALAVTIFWSSMMEKYGKTYGDSCKKIGITLALIALICVSGSMKNPIDITETGGKEQKAAEMILAKISETGPAGECMIWAPKEIMEWARSLNGQVQLPYGRNMWDEALNAYVYDVYGSERVALYEWMTRVEETGAAEEEVGKVCLDMAEMLGVTHVVLPKGTEPELLATVEETLDTKGLLVGEYYLYCMQ